MLRCMVKITICSERSSCRICGPGNVLTLAGPRRRWKLGPCRCKSLVAGAEAFSEEEEPLLEGEEEDEALTPLAAVVDRQVQSLHLAVSTVVGQVILPRTAVNDSSRNLLAASDAVDKAIALPSVVPRPT